MKKRFVSKNDKPKIKTRFVILLSTALVLTIIFTGAYQGWLSFAPAEGDEEITTNTTNLTCDNDYSKGYSDGYIDGYIDGNITGYLQGFLEGNDTGYDQGYSDGNITGYLQGFLEGNSTGYITGYSDGYLAGFTLGNSTGYDQGYSDGYTAAFEQNQIRFHGSCTVPINFYNTQSSSISSTANFTNINNSQYISINNYNNQTMSFNSTISNIRLYNSTIIQDNFTEDNTQAVYTMTASLTLYQQLTITNNLTLTSISFIGLAAANARPVILLYNYNNGIVGSLITTLNASSVALTNGLQLITLTFSRELSVGNYFIGLRTSSGNIRISTSYSTGVNGYITLYGASLANIDYAINYTISPPTYTNDFNFIHYGLFNANDSNSYIRFDFINYVGHMDYHDIIYNISTISILWRWVNLTFDINFSIIYGYDREITFNMSKYVNSMSLRNNQSTSFWGGIEDGNIIPADITYYTTTDIMCTSFGITINEYSWRFNLASPPVFKVGYEYNMTVTAMNATIYDVIGTTWECHFDIWYTINEINYYTEINHLFVFDVMRI